MRGELFLKATGEFICAVHEVKIQHDYFSGTVAEHVDLDLRLEHALHLSGNDRNFRVVSLWTLRHLGALRLNGKIRSATVRP